MKQINTTNWEAEFDKKFTAFENVYADKQELKQFIKDLLASSQKDKEMAVERERERCVGIVKNEIRRQYGLRAGCPYCGKDLCDCEGGRKTALRILEALQTKEDK